MHPHGAAKEVGRGVFRQIDPVCAAEVNGLPGQHRTAVVDNDPRRDIAEVPVSQLS